MYLKIPSEGTVGIRQYDDARLGRRISVQKKNTWQLFKILSKIETLILVAHGTDFPRKMFLSLSVAMTGNKKLL